LAILFFALGKGKLQVRLTTQARKDRD